MRKLFEDRQFQGVRDSGSGRIYQGLEFHRCYFQSCFAFAKKPKRRVTFRDVVLLNCEVRGCDLTGAIVEDAVVQGLKTHGLLQTWATVFKHVVLRGKIGDIMLSHLCDPTRPESSENAAFAEANAAYYAGVDWAFDISQAIFMHDCDLLYGVVAIKALP